MMPTTSCKFTELPRKASYQDVLGAPPNKVAELIDDELHLHARPSEYNLWTCGQLFVMIKRRYGFDGDGVSSEESAFLLDPELRLGDDVLVPNIAGWRVGNLPRIPLEPFSHVVPDWVCEVLSPSTREIDLGRKSDIYAREGVLHLWICDPEERTLQAFALSAGKWHAISTLTDEEIGALPPFEKLDIRLSHIWVGGPMWPLSE